MAVDENFWKEKRVFLTGHTGFKGAWLGLWLSSMGAKVVGYALAPDTQPNMFNLVGLEGDLHSIFADIRDKERLFEEVHRFQPEIILHMAAQPLVRRSYRDPLETFETNIIGTANILEAGRLSKSLKVFLNVTSDKCYQNREREKGYREDEAMGGHDPYSASKGCAELVTASYRSSFFPIERHREHGVSVGSARAGNVFGGGDWSEDRLIPDAIRSMIKGESMMVRYPKAVRPWQFVLEPLRGYLQLAEQMYLQGELFAEGWNFGPSRDDEVTVETVLSKLQETLGDKFCWEKDSDHHPHEASLLRLDTQKSQVRLGWIPVCPLDEGLTLTARWYKEVLENPSSARKVSLRTLNDYLSCFELPQDGAIAHAG